MSDSIRVPNYYDGAENLYRSLWASDGSSTRQDTLHQTMYIRIDDDDNTQVVWGEDALTTGVSGWYNFPTITHPDDGELTITGAKIPVTITIIDDLGAETDYEMGESQTTVTLTPGLDRSFVNARILKRV